MPSYTYWQEYLKRARNGHDRPIDGSRSKRVLRGPNGDIILRLHYTNVVVLHQDGTETITTGGWNTVTTRRFLDENSRARVWSDKCQMYVRVAEPTLTAPRVQKCRTCHGKGTQPVECYGPSWCYAGERGYSYSWSSHPAVECPHGQTEHHRNETCGHGQTGRHVTGDTECYRCHGEGRVDYGSNPVHYAWDGDPLIIDAQGHPVGPVPAPVYTAPAVVASTSKPAAANYSDSGRLLTEALPALRTKVTCPDCARADMDLESMIIHLNDSAKWSRERIADWLDTLDLDLSFPVPETIRADIA